MSKEVTFAEKNSFIQREARPDKYKADLVSFKKVFPNNVLIPALEKTNEYNRQGLHERMLLTLLQAKTPAEILQMRGEEGIKPVKSTNTPAAPKTGLAAMQWREVQKLAKELGVSIWHKTRPQVQEEIEAAQEAAQAAKKKSPQE